MGDWDERGESGDGVCGKCVSILQYDESSEVSGGFAHDYILVGLLEYDCRSILGG